MIQQNPKIRRLKRVRAKLALNIQIPRLSVFRSNQHMWAQIIDDKKGNTLASATTKTIKDKKTTKTQKAFELGKVIADLAIKLNIKKVRFDRGLYLYHGRVKAVAEGARAQGLQL